MSFAVLIAINFSIGFFFESIVGFGGGLIAYSLLGFFTDNFKESVLAGLYIGTLASFHIGISDYKSFDRKIFLSVIPISIIGTFIGVLIFSKFSTEILSFIFGILLILLATKNIFFEHYIFPKFFKSKLIFLGSLSQGIFGVGGPFLVNALKDDFKNKSHLRTTMAVFFLSFNLVRIFQLKITEDLNMAFFLDIWWTVIPVFFAIKLGHLIHIKTNELIIKKFITTLTLIAGIKFLVKIF